MAHRNFGRRSDGVGRVPDNLQLITENYSDNDSSHNDGDDFYLADIGSDDDLVSDEDEDDSKWFCERVGEPAARHVPGQPPLRPKTEFVDIESPVFACEAVYGGSNFVDVKRESDLPASRLQSTVTPVRDPAYYWPHEQLGVQVKCPAEQPSPYDVSAWVWTGNRELFQGSRERFVGPNPGPLVYSREPVDYFLNFFDSTIVESIVTETNRYADQILSEMTLSRDSRFKTWKPTNSNEIYILLSMFLLMGCYPRNNCRSYFSKDIFKCMPLFLQLMSGRRYFLLTKFLHFVDDLTIPQFDCDSKIIEIYPVLSYLTSKFQQSYNLSQNICIDESLLLWKGRLSWRQYIMSKRSKTGIKLHELCDSRTGYCWNLTIQSEKSVSFDPTLPGVGKSEQAILEITKDILNRGHTIWLNNCYNSPDLARYLKRAGTDCAGTIKLNRKNMPAEILSNTPGPGELLVNNSTDVQVISWRHNSVVTMVTTFHDISFQTGRRDRIEKPNVVADYNKNMRGIDRSNQMLSSYLVETERGTKWAIKVFKRLLNLSILNSYLMYKQNVPRINEESKAMGIAHKPLEHFEFRVLLAKQLVARFAHRKLVERLGVLTNTRSRKSTPGLPPMTPIRCMVEDFNSGHMPKYFGGREQKGRRDTKDCIQCSSKAKRVRSPYWCPTCSVCLCVDPCFEDYHMGVQKKQIGKSVETNNETKMVLDG